MPARVATSANASRRSARQLAELSDAFLEQRLGAELTQSAVATACHMSRNHYRALEGGKALGATLAEINRVAGVLGLDIAIRAYPGASAMRDAGHARRLGRFLAVASQPLSYRFEVALPSNNDRWERRAWDAMLFGRGRRTAIELEMRLRDVQATRRRHSLKWRDDPTEQFLLLLADTRHNRRTVAEFADMFADLPSLGRAAVRASLEAGAHPPTGMVFV